MLIWRYSLQTDVPLSSERLLDSLSSSSSYTFLSSSPTHLFVSPSDHFPIRFPTSSFLPSIRLSYHHSLSHFISSSIYPTVRLSVSPSVQPPVRPSVCPSVHQPVHLSVCQSGRINVRLSINCDLPSVSLDVRPSIRMYIRTSVRRSVRVSVSFPISPYILQLIYPTMHQYVRPSAHPPVHPIIAFYTHPSTGVQPGFWRGGGSVLGQSTKMGSGGVSLEKFLENVHAFCPLYCICCIKIIIFFLFYYFNFFIIFICSLSFFSFFLAGGGGARPRTPSCATVRPSIWSVCLRVLSVRFHRSSVRASNCLRGGQLSSVYRPFIPSRSVHPF